MLFSTLQKIETLLTTIDRLGVVKIKHLLEIHDLKSYRNACRIINTQLRPYIHETYFQKEKIIYLNKKGRDLIASDKPEFEVSLQAIHSLLRNEVYIHFKCPKDWRNEYTLEVNIKPKNNFDIMLKGFTPIDKKKIVSDAAFKRNSYLHVIEVDNTQDMRINKKKIEMYKDILPAYKEETPILYFFTQTESRKKKLLEWLKGVRHEVLTFVEIR
jgi:hypothetical protein